MAAPQYKLSYFNGRYLAEPIRLILHLAKVPFEDFRFEMEEWAKLKGDMPWGTVPVLEVDGLKISQSKAICRYLARKYGLIGDTLKEAAKCDELVDAADDMRLATLKWFYKQDPVKKLQLLNELEEEILPKWFTMFEKVIEGNGSGFLVNQGITYADIFVAYWVDNMASNYFKVDMERFPKLKKLLEKVFEQKGIKEWVEKRPQTVW